MHCHKKWSFRSLYNRDIVYSCVFVWHQKVFLSNNFELFIILCDRNTPGLIIRTLLYSYRHKYSFKCFMLNSHENAINMRLRINVYVCYYKEKWYSSVFYNWHIHTNMCVCFSMSNVRIKRKHTKFVPAVRPLPNKLYLCLICHLVDFMGNLIT